MNNCCETAFRICKPIPDCLETLSISTGQVSDELTLIIVDKFQKQYQFEVETDADGIATIEIIDEDGIQNPDIPVGLFNPYAGVFKLSMTGEDGAIPFTINGTEYGHIQFEAIFTLPKQTEYTLIPQ